MSIKAYQRVATQADDPRGLEYRAFGQVTAGLVRAKEEKAQYAALAEVLDANRLLWNILSADCQVAQNALPPGLRSQIIALALWVGQYSSQVLRAGAELDPLIDINRSIMEGLSAR